MFAPRRLAVILTFVATALQSAGADRPRIGLALGGGGARGCAHAGVLRVLERMNIPVDYIVTAIVGAQTVAGPVLFGYGRAETGDDHFYIAIGKTF
jgi:NTE family protein